MSMRKVCYGGFTYDSVRDFTDTYKIDRAKLMHHVRSGWSIYESIRYQSACTYSKEFKGLGYKGVEDFVRRNRLSFPLFMRFFEETLDVEESNRLTRRHIIENGSDLIEFRGDRYRKILSVCNTYGITEKEVVDRIMMGEQLLDVLNDMIDVDAKKQVKDREGIFVDGIPFDSVSHVARHFDINLNALLSRTYHGDSIEIAVKKLLNNTFLYNGVHYKSLTDIERITGVGIARLQRAYRKYGDADQAVKVSMELKSNNINRKIIKREEGFWNYAGIVFSSANKMDKAFGLVIGTVHRLVRDDGMTPEEAVDYAIDYTKAKADREAKKAELDAHAKKVFDELYGIS